MADKGWTADPAQLLRYQVVIALDGNQSDVYNVAQVLGVEPAAVGDVYRALVDRRLATTFTRRAGAEFPEDATLTGSGRALLSEWNAARTPSGTKRACIAAMLDWLDANDGVAIQSSDDFARDVRAHFYGQRFDIDVQIGVARDLHSQKLLTGTPIGGGSGPVIQPQITTLGRVVSTKHAGDLVSWQSATDGGSRTTINVSGSTGVTVASNSPGAQQSVHVTTDVSEQLLNLAAALEQMMTSLGLGPADFAAANGLVPQLREAAGEAEADPGKARRLLETFKAVVVNGTGSAAGTALVALAQQISENL